MQRGTGFHVPIYILSHSDINSVTAVPYHSIFSLLPSAPLSANIFSIHVLFITVLHSIYQSSVSTLHVKECVFLNL